MKKITFAFQVFGFMAIIPLVLAFEMNQGKEKLPVPGTSTGIRENLKNDPALVAGKSREQSATVVWSLMLNAATTQQSDGEQCNCNRDCNCEITQPGLSWEFPIISHLE